MLLSERAVDWIGLLIDSCFKKLGVDRATPGNPLDKTASNAQEFEAIIDKLSSRPIHVKSASKELCYLTGSRPAIREMFLLFPDSVHSLLGPIQAHLISELAEHLLHAILNVSTEERVKLLLGQEEVVTALVDALAQNVPEKTRFYAASCLFSLSQLLSNRHLIEECNVLPQIVDAVSEEGSSAVYRALVSFFMIACNDKETDIRSLALDLQLVPKVMHKIVSRDVGVAESVALLDLLCGIDEEAAKQILDPLLLRSLLNTLRAVVDEEEGGTTVLRCLSLIKCICSHDQARSGLLLEIVGLDENAKGTITGLACAPSNPDVITLAKDILKMLRQRGFAKPKRRRRRT